MSLTAADVAEIMRLVEQSSFAELTLEMEGIKLCLRRGTSSVHVVEQVKPAQPVFPVAPATQRPTATPPAPEDPAVQDVTAPLLGTFYRSPKPGAPPFVEPGAAVEADSIVAIIEVMKLMNTVRAGVRGTVTEVLARDGELVEYGETLLRVRKSS